ncbi:MAG: LytTR family transcriptional regulator DNA-binding domain-containing protein [Hymenobacteraceae bacterium]|nr:LytTR family transcriptional regulator DNA-binding domain-containing protein [Hymenobacteraceae bacterium]
MATILIVEDEALIAAAIEDTIRRLGHTPLEPVDNSDDALAALTQQPVDLVLMDINIEGDTDGIATALLVRRQFAVPVVFLTAQSDPATLNRAKLARPAGYVLKPFTDDSLRVQLELALAASRPAALSVAESQVAESASVDSASFAQFFFVKKGPTYVKLRVTDIRYLEALENYVRLHTTKGQYVVYSTLKELESRLPAPPFFRTHRSHVVNLDQVEGYEEGCVLFGEEAVPVSRTFKDELKVRLNLL